jgi:hypothetical protein
MRTSEYTNLPFMQKNSKLFSAAESRIYDLAEGDFSKSNLD